jgi:sugar phosphate permease
VISFTTFIAVFVYERLGHNMNKTVLLMFVCATVFFALTYFVKQPVLNIVCIVLAIMSSNGAASMLWSRYCPSLRDTGMVSGATGFLDFSSYMAAAMANLVFANAVSSIGWENLILVWLGLMIVGVAVSLPYKRNTHCE